MDVLVVLLAIVAGISGWRHGLAVAFLSFIGVLGGAILGVQLAPLLAANVEAKNTQVIVSVVVVVVLVALGETTGVYFGRHIRDKLTGERTLTVDSALGSVLQAITVVLAAWLVALPLATANLPGLASEVRGSHVLRAVDSVMPAPARELPADFHGIGSIKDLAEAKDFVAQWRTRLAKNTLLSVAWPVEYGGPGFTSVQR